MAISKDKIYFDTTSPNAGDNLGAYLRASDGTLLTHTATALNINISSGTNVKSEDAAHGSGDSGNYVLSVRQDNPVNSTSADGDYQSFKSDFLGRLWINESSNNFAHSAVSVTTIATDLVATDLANRKKIIIQNNGNKDIFVGNSGVTAVNGLRISAGSSAELTAGPLADLYAITSSGTANVRVFELA